MLSMCAPFLMTPLAVAWLSIAALPGGEMSPETLLKEALHRDRTLRQPEEAAAAYRKVIAAEAASPATRAQAHLGLGSCLERMGRTGQAREQFDLVVRRFADQTRLVDRAKRRLAVISASDPAILMPPETQLYIESVRPGVQAERFIGSLKGLDEPGLERMLKRFGISRSLQSIRAFLNEAMREDLSRIDAVALGIISAEALPGRTDFKFLIVLHSGKSVAARGLLALMAQSAGEPSGGHGAVKLWDLPDGDDGVLTFANLPDKPGLSGVMLLGKDRQVVCRAIDRWRAGGKASGLASLPEFRRQAAARRLDSTVLVYADVPQILARFQQDLRPEERSAYEAGRQLLALDKIERGIARVALLDDEVVFELGLMFNDKPNPFYAMLRTPRLDRSLLAFVPTETAAAALMSMGRGDEKWAQIDLFLEQVPLFEQALGAEETLNISEVIRGAEAMTGLSVAEDLLGNCRSLAVIAPTIRPSRSGLTKSGAANMVLVLRMHKPDAFSQRLSESLLDQLRAGMETRQVAGIETRTYMHTPMASDVALSVARIRDTFLITLSAEMLEWVLSAYARGDVMARSALGRRALSQVPHSANKLLVMRPELLINDLRALDGQPPLAFRPVRPVVAYTLEQDRQMAVRVLVGDLTGVLNNMILAAGSATLSSAPAIAASASRPAPPQSGGPRAP